MKNTATRYGFLAKILHWIGFLLILNQFVVAAAMLNTEEWETTAGFTQGALYEWHKSVGLVVLAVVIARFAWRKLTPLPDWAPNLNEAERRAIHWIEHILYACMFLMPISGYVFVMAGDYPLIFFGLGQVPNIVGVDETVALVAEWTHKLTAILLGVTVLAHWVVVLRHQLIHQDRYPHRMLPFTHQR
jgi:cytochrome b561